MAEPAPQHQVPSGPMGQYYLLDKLAQGGMAEIYKGLAYDLHGIRRTVVIKKILPHVAAHREFIDMLVTEAKLAVQLTHGNIAQIYDLGKVGSDYFMVMEYVDGKSVGQIMRKAAQSGETVPIPIAAHIAAEAASGLHYMHSRADAAGKPLNIIHRDISPQNLMLTTGGTVKIIDFGIAKAATTIEVTDAGVVKGKFAYMSPEQASGDPLNWLTDVFSLGVVLFEMLTGRRLFKGKDNQETLRNVRRASVPRPSLYRPDIPPELDEIVLKALAKTRTDRYGSAGDLRDDLFKFIHHHAPSFQNADIESYLHHLFHDDACDADKEDSHTPLLIIDRTQSAILQPPVSDELPPHSSDHNAEDHSEWTPLLQPIEHHRRQRQVIIVVSLILSGVLAIGLGYWRSQRWGASSLAVTAPQQRLPLPELPHETPVVVPVLPMIPPPPPEPFGDIVISSEPAGAEIFLDDRPTGLTTPTTLSHLPAESRHLVGLHMQGRKFWTNTVNVRAGGVERINAQLEIDFAGLEIMSTPTAATVTINGSVAGQTPFIQHQLNPGDVFEILVTKDGYLPWKMTLQAESGHLKTLRPVLEKDPHAGPQRPHYVEPLTPAPTTLPSAR